ncbi:hypothetical protein [Streptomyces sp. NPDC057579]|uniref:hypothetical protein n=1 Tax=Streptomyces sp. NPDC057579 TaxID=3346172 RepID=UPI0036C3FE95
MPHPEADLHLRLDLLHGRPSAVTATITGTPTHIVRALLAVHGFEPLDDTTMVMARIDREEAHYAELAARALRAEGVTVDITPQLREEIDTEWTWANYPMPWCSREEIREVSGDAQQIYDAIRHGRLIIHAHDGWTTVAVGTYRDGPSIHLPRPCCTRRSQPNRKPPNGIAPRWGKARVDTGSQPQQRTESSSSQQSIQGRAGRRRQYSGGSPVTETGDPPNTCSSTATS